MLCLYYINIMSELMDETIYSSSFKVLLAIGFVIDLVLVILAVYLDLPILLFIMAILGISSVFIFDNEFKQDERSEIVRSKAAAISNKIYSTIGLIVGIVITIVGYTTIGYTIIVMAFLLVLLDFVLTFVMDEKYY